jgi:hypothetical protein
MMMAPASEMLALLGSCVMVISAEKTPGSALRVCASKNTPGTSLLHTLGLLYPTAARLQQSVKKMPVNALFLLGTESRAPHAIIPNHPIHVLHTSYVFLGTWLGL